MKFHLTSETLLNLQESLVDWYLHNGRLDLPWRNFCGQVSNPPSHLAHIERSYGVYISEIMLQQTQVPVVLERFFFPFLKRFPTLQSLAHSQEDDVLRLWQGLGYYSRARNLRKSAIICMEKHHGNLPQSRLDLKKLPGIGEYTSGAIACFGFDASVSFVDGNIARVLSRFFALVQPTKQLLEQIAQAFLNLKDPYNHNQALIDLGATICTPKNPHCLLCPLQASCLGKINPLLYPTSNKVQFKTLDLYLGFFREKNKISLLQSKTRLYYGLYNPIFLKKPQGQALGSFKHHYTKYKINAQVFLCAGSPPNQAQFFSQEELLSLPLSNLCKKALKLL